MTVNLYQSNSNVLKLHKTKKLIRTVQAQVKDIKEVLQPVICMNTDEYDESVNFFTIEEFGRSYQKKAIEKTSGGKTYLYGEVDPLDSFLEDIEKISGVVGRSTTYSDPNVRDTLKPLMPYKQRETANFTVSTDDTIAIDNNGNPIYANNAASMAFNENYDEFVLILNG